MNSQNRKRSIARLETYDRKRTVHRAMLGNKGAQDRAIAKGWIKCSSY